MDRTLGHTGLKVAPVAFGAFKIGRNQKVKYQDGYELPSEAQTEELLNGVIDSGINLIDTAPAYGSSEERIGRHLARRRDELVLSSKIGETFDEGQSTYRFDRASTTDSIARSLNRLQTDHLDIAFVHSDGRDTEIIESTDALSTLVEHKQKGDIRFIGFSGKTVAGHLMAINSGVVDVLMVEYHSMDESQGPVIQAAEAAGIGVLVKKGLAAGRLDPHSAIPFCLEQPAVASVVIGSLQLSHLKDNLRIAKAAIDR